MRAKVQQAASTAYRVPQLGRPPSRDEEHTQQVLFMARLDDLATRDPDYALAVRRTHAIPNGGGRTRREAGRLKAEGVRAGVPDIFVAIARAKTHGMYIEMKSSTGRVRPEQRAWLEDCKQLKFVGIVCRSADEAFDAWRDYVDGYIGVQR
jgi:hypothetical protein